MTSPYLNRKPRTLAQAQFDREVNRLIREQRWRDCAIAQWQRDALQTQKGNENDV